MPAEQPQDPVPRRRLTDRAEDGEVRLRDVAPQLCAQAGQLLGGTVFVTNADDRVIAASRSGYQGRLLRVRDDPKAITVPVRLGGEDGWLIARPERAEEAPAHLARAVMELLLDQAAIVGALPQGPAVKNKIIHDLLRGNGADEVTLVRQAHILGMDLEPPRAVILVDASSYLPDPASAGDLEVDGESERRAQRVIDGIVDFFRLPNDTICAYVGAAEIAVLKASDTRNLVHWAEVPDESSSSWANLAALKRAAGALLERLRQEIDAPLSIGVGRYHRGPGGLARSYQDARAALTLGRRLRGEGIVHSLDALGVAAFVGVADDRTKHELATHLLSPLDGDPELIGTLEAFFEEDCHAVRVAERLGIHRNTLAYRLAKVAERTGLDPRVFDEAVQIRLALVLQSLHEGVAPGG